MLAPNVIAPVILATVIYSGSVVLPILGSVTAALPVAIDMPCCPAVVPSIPLAFPKLTAVLVVRIETSSPNVT